MKKRILSMLLVLLMVLGMLPTMASAETATPEIKSVQMVLNSILNINLKVDLKGNPAENYTMEVTVGDGATQTLTGKAEGNLYVYTAKVMAHQMTDIVSIALKNGETVVAEETWTVSSYVDAITADADASAEIKEVAQAMYNYGQYAAYYKNGGNDPAIDVVTNAAAVGEEHKFVLNTNNAALKAVASLYLDEACDLRFKFNKEAMNGLTLYVDDQAVTASDLNDTQVQYVIPEILPQDYAVKHTVQVKNGEDVVYDLSYSVLSYIFQAQKNTGSSYETLNKLLKAMQLYGTAADAYCDTLPVYLTEANAGTPELFASTINAAPAKTYLLAEDLDWTGLATTDHAVTVFDGILDGQGHAIKGFTMGVGGDGAGNYHTCLFGTNNGTIKNIAFDYNVAAAAGNTMGLVAKNSGTVENLFVKAEFSGYSWTTGTIVATNDGTGTVKNSIAVVSSTLTDQPAKDRLGSIVGVDYNGKIINCYAVNTENAVATPYTDTWGNGDYTGSAVFENNQALLDASANELTEANGWASYWTVTAEGIAFNGKVVIAGAVCIHEDVAYVDGKCDLCGADVAIPEGVVLLNMTNAGTPGNFSSIVSANPGYTYYLTEDLDWNDQSSAAVAVFDGILNGQGHSIKGFAMGVGGDGAGNYHTCLFGTNNGTIKNIAFTYHVAAAGGNTMGLVAVNSGTVENVFVAADFAGYSWTTGAIIATNQGSGTIQNSIAAVSSTLADQPAKNRLGAIVGVDYNGKIMNCYAVNTENSLTTPYVDTWGYGNYAGSAVYASNEALLDAVSALSVEDGWASYWSIGEGGIAFNGKVVIEGVVVPPCEHVDSAPLDGKCDLCGEEVEAPEGVYFINSQTAATAADFAALINADLDGTYYVTEDLTYSGNVGIGEFAGILDGQGHSIKGMNVALNGQGGWTANMINVNSGLIQNIALEYTITTTNNNENALVGTNKGTIQNVYAKAIVNAVKTEYGTNSALVGINDGESAAVVQNCIVDVIVADTITSFPDTYGAVVSRNAAGATVDKSYYRVTGAAMPGIAYPWSTQTVAVLDTSVTALPSVDGWASCWKADDTGLYFGDILIMAAAPKCDHVDASPVDGKCDLCGEAVALPENTYLINSQTAATAADFAALINADLDGTFYVTEDLTYSGNVGIGEFAGVLDGQGHSIKGMNVALNGQGGWTANMFNVNSGLIQNIALEYTITTTNNNENALVGTNKGTIQNVYAKAIVNAVKTEYGTNSALVGINDGESAAVVQNCIVDVIVADTITSFPDTYGAVVSRNAAGAAVDKSYYRVTGAAMPGIAYPWSTVNSANVLNSSVAALPSDEGWSRYWKANAAGIWFNGIQILDTGIELADEAIAVLSTYEASGVSNDTVALKGSSEDDRANIFAWYDFQKLYQEITGEAIEVVFVDSVNQLDNNRSYFILGGTLANKAGHDNSGITTDNGHKIVKSGDDIYLYGKSGYGTANAMYAFLKQAFGAEFYSDTVYTTTGSTYSIDTISNATFNPSVDYNWSYDGLLFQNNGEAINYAYQMRMGFVNYWQIQGGSFHAFSELFAGSDYSVNVDLNAGGTIGTGSSYVQTVADYVYNQAKNTGRPVIAVGPADTHDWSTSSASQANLNTYGANSGEYLLFMNAVIELLNTDSKYADIPAVDVAMLVYNGSLAAPSNNLDALAVNTNTARGVKLTAMFAPIEMNVNGTPTDSTIKDYYGNTPAYYYGEYAKWQNIFGANNVYFWRYSTIFNDFLVPVNTVKYIQANYQALIGSDNYIKHMMDQGTGLSPAQTNFQALLVYLKGQLGKNANADLDALITNFCNAYYGEAAGEYIKQLLLAEQSHLTTLSTTMNNTSTGFLGTGKKADISGCHSVPASSGGWFSSTNNLYAAKWWSKNCSDDDGEMLRTWYGYITSALAATNDAEQQARIRVEAIALRYISLKAHGVALISNDSLAQVEADAIALGITRYSEGQAIENLA